MSGGVDSSVAAALLAEQGHDVIGVSMQLYDQSEGQTGFGTCCTIDDLYDARRVASALGIPHYIVNFENRFDEQVVSNFIREYTSRPNSHPVCPLQRRPEVLDAARALAGLRRRRPRHRALRTRGPRGGRDLRVTPRGRRGEGSDLLSLLADAAATRASLVSGRASRQGRRPRARKTPPAPRRSEAG